MYKVRTAKRGFKGSCGHPIAPGTRFIVEEPRPAFHCASCATARVKASLEQVLSELTAADERAAEGGQ